MTVELSDAVEEQLRHFAKQHGRDVRGVIEEAVQQYLEAAAITDIEPDDIAQTQLALMGELSLPRPWTGAKPAQ